MRCFRNERGAIYASLDDDGTLRKNEKQKDRLRVTGGRSHAIDEGLLDEVLQAGGRLLEIKERGLSGEVRVFQIPLRDIYRFGRRVTLAGISRWTVPLSYCELVRGSEEEWRLTARAELLKAESRREEVAAIRGEQGFLFSDEERNYWQNRLVHEM